MKNKTKLFLCTCILTLGTMNAAGAVLAAQPAQILTNENIDMDDSISGFDSYYVNTDSEAIKNANAKITAEEAAAAKEERSKLSYELGYKPYAIFVSFDRKKAAATAKKLNLDNEEDLYRKYVRDHGDNSLALLKDDSENVNETISFYLNVNDNKTVKTAVAEYSKLEEVIEAKLFYVDPNEYPTPVIPPVHLTYVYAAYGDDSITFKCSIEYETGNADNTYRWEYCKIGSDEWHLISDWSKSKQCTWYPDANEEYAVVCKASSDGNETIDSEIVWYASRPQMNKRITGRCALPTEDGILFGCTSTVGKDDKDYLTTCYIWSFEQQTWITKAAYEASDCAWYKASNLPKGNYIMYNCTEKKMPDGTLRKLSCDYYHFAI